jgi:hypothetical protein
MPCFSNPKTGKEEKKKKTKNPRKSKKEKYKKETTSIVAKGRKSVGSEPAIDNQEHQLLDAVCSCAVDLDNVEDVLPADGTDLDLACARNASANMSTVIEESVLLLAETNLAEVHLFIRNLPVADTFAVALAILVSTNILVACLTFDECSLTVALVLKPVTIVSIAGRVLHKALAVALAEDVVASVGSDRVRYMLAFPVIVALHEVAAVEVRCEGGINSLCAAEGLCGVIASSGPEIAD